MATSCQPIHCPVCVWSGYWRCNLFQMSTPPCERWIYLVFNNKCVCVVKHVYAWTLIYIYLFLSACFSILIFNYYICCWSFLCCSFSCFVVFAYFILLLFPCETVLFLCYINKVIINVRVANTEQIFLEFCGHKHRVEDDRNPEENNGERF